MRGRRLPALTATASACLIRRTTRLDHPVTIWAASAPVSFTAKRKPTPDSGSLIIELIGTTSALFRSKRILRDVEVEGGHDRDTDLSLYAKPCR